VRALPLLALPAAGLAAQLEVLTLLNWQRLPIGEQSAVEGGATVARVNGPAAGWTNPAGLSRLERPSVSGTVNAVEYTRVGSRTGNGQTDTDDLSLRANLVGFANTLDGGGGWSFLLTTPIAWNSDIELRNEGAAGVRTDDGSSSLEASVASLAWGTPLGDAAIGVALEGWLVDYRYGTGATADDGTSVLTSTYTENGRQVDLRLAVGVQAAAGAWRLGALVRSPGIGLSTDGSVSSSTTTGDGTTTVLTRISDENVGFDLPLPWEVHLGAAWMPESAPGLEIEADLAIHGGGPRSSVLGAATGTVTTITGGGTTVTGTRLAGRELDLRLVVNPRLGMRYRFEGILLERAWTAHLGAYLERSPVADSNLFAKLDLLGGTAGISAEKGPMQVTVGGTYVTNGTLTDAIGYAASPDSTVAPTLDNADATFAIRTFVLTIASSYRF
jgi:hypothetical protein